MKRAWALVALFALILAATAQDAIPTTLYSNATTTPDASVCCFIVQDTITEVWAQIFSTSTFYQVVNKTSLTVRVTPFPDGTSTNVETNVYTTNGTFSIPVGIGQNPISLFANDAPGVAEVTATYNSSQTVTGGVTIASPNAAYIYTSLKIITVAPVTNSKGDLVCGTDFSFPTTTLHNINGSISTETPTALNTILASSEDATYSNVNSNAQAYFGGYGIIGTSTSNLPPEVTVVTRTNSDSNGVPTATTMITDTNNEVVTFFINSKFESVDVNIPRPSGFTLTFEPFVYTPSSGQAGKTGDGSIGCQFSTGTEGYGYPPQTLLDSVIANPTISSQYPGLASCLPAGPSLIHPSQCSAVAPVFQEAGGDLTDSTIITVMPTAIPDSEGPTPVSSAKPPESPTPTAPGATPVDNQSPNPQNPTTPPVPNPPSSTDAIIASGIASIIGASPIPLPGSPTIISGSTEIVISGPTTVPMNPELPGLVGSVTVISETSFVVVGGATTVPLVASTGSGSGSEPLQASGAGGTRVKTRSVMLLMGLVAFVFV